MRSNPSYAAVKSAVSSRAQLVAEMQAVLREAGEFTSAVGTGLERNARISASTTVELAGNSANAALAAGRRAAAVRAVNSSSQPS